MYLRDQLTGEVIFDEFGNPMIIGVRAMLNTDDELCQISLRRAIPSGLRLWPTHLQCIDRHTWRHLPCRCLRRAPIHTTQGTTSLL